MNFKKNFNKFFALNTYLLCISLFCSTSLAAQTTNISGIVNTYHKVIEVIPAKACLRVANVSGLNVNTRIMVVQMKGASINTANNSSFGDTISLNTAGNYEIGTICYIIGDSVFLFHDLLNNYDVNNKVQIVQFAQYFSANVVDTVKAAPWDSAAGLGGVIAIYAEQDFTLNAPVYADSSGYHGGIYSFSNGTCFNVFPATGYIYNATFTSPQSGSYKGESVANLAPAQTGGRGAPANGGGGGNNHNNAGGGGANLTGGGNGGGNSSTTGCITDLKGLGGKALRNWNGSKIFLGGGGGAGHTNSGVATFCYGGKGGGIVFIWANNVIGNNFPISAKGGMGGPSMSDGAGGGGAGGTIIMHVTNYTGPVSIETNGGDGGTSDNGVNLGRCYGGGGGGGGGGVYFTGALPAITINANGGAAGIEFNRDAACNPLVPAQAGNNGLITANYAFATSTSPAGYCQILLPLKLTSFTALLNDKKIIFNWQVQNPEQALRYYIERSFDNLSWTDIQTINGDDFVVNYSATDYNPPQGTIYYRLRIIEKNNTVSYSPVRKIVINGKNSFSFFPNPASSNLYITTSPPLSYLQIIDASGKIILKKTINGGQSILDISKLQTGVYFIRVNEPGGHLFLEKLFVH